MFFTQGVAAAARETDKAMQLPGGLLLHCGSRTKFANASRKFARNEDVIELKLKVIRGGTPRERVTQAARFAEESHRG